MRVGRVTLRIGLLILLLPCAVLGDTASLEQAPADRLLSDAELVALLDRNSPAAAEINRRYREDPEAGLQALAAWFRDRYAERYFFDWTTVDARFADYRARFPSREAQHRAMAQIHSGLYPARARWKLPYRNLQGDEVSAYELRHLARQHKVLDMAYVHHYEGGDPEFVRYFTEQMRSLNEAFAAREFEDDAGGNGVYESFRAGYRVINWLRIHALFLGSPDYRWQDQLELIRTLLHTGAVLQDKNRSFRYGNHQTRGAVALVMIAILLNDFAGTDAWYGNAMAILGEHLEKEVNPDGFQFERSVHYHVGDITNYFQVLQLAQLNGFPVPAAWRAKLKAMFDAAVVLARPDRRLPVLQDDTDAPWAEYNEMGDFMLLGSVLFDDPAINYFAGTTIAPSIYWLLRDEQIRTLNGLERSRPVLASAELPDTGYYVMRDGWEPDDLYLAITAGLSAHKPDHQHGDMLGLVGWARGQEILPNYQVRYSLPDYDHFKNSLVKNVAIVDGVLHGRDWKGNRGGSGFGKWGQLPQPSAIAWVKHETWDFFAGTHDGYADLGVDYFRKVLFLKGFGWIVRDLFQSVDGGRHNFQQVWQGHYSDEGGGNHHRSTFADGSGLDIVQLGERADDWSTGVRRGKGRLVYTRSGESAGFTTLLFPFRAYNERVPESLRQDGPWSAGGWTLYLSGEDPIETAGVTTDARAVLVDATGIFLLNATWLEAEGRRARFSERSDLRIDRSAGPGRSLTWLGHRPGKLEWVGEDSARPGTTLQPGGRAAWAE